VRELPRPAGWWRYIRKRGVARALRAFTYRFIYRSHRCVITWTRLDGPPEPDHIGDVVFRLATPSDFDRLAEFEGYGRGSAQRAYVEGDKDWLFLACHAERIVATRRLSRVIRDPVISRVVHLEPGQVWGADTFCLPDYRNRGVSRHLQKFAERHLAKLGYKERLGNILITNTPSLRMSRASGSAFVSYVSYVRVLFWERLRISEDLPRRLLDDLT
jgi:GNAT superfamily N-acetyltransferase